MENQMVTKVLDSPHNNKKILLDSR